MDVKEFQDRLKEIQSIAQSKNKILDAADIHSMFDDCGLDHSQLLGVIKYLISQGITIEGFEEDKDDGNEETHVKEKVPLTDEEKAYLDQYMQELPDIEEDVEELFETLAAGEENALGRLSSYYMRSVAEMAVELNTAEIPLADLIQEAGLNLVQTLGCAGTVKRDEKWLMDEVRKGILSSIEEQTQRKFADDSLVARVEKLENAVRELSDDEEDGKSAFSIDELAIILDMNVEEIRDTLRLTGDDK